MLNSVAVCSSVGVSVCRTSAAAAVLGVMHNRCDATDETDEMAQLLYTGEARGSSTRDPLAGSDVQQFFGRPFVKGFAQCNQIVVCPVYLVVCLSVRL